MLKTLKNLLEFEKDKKIFDIIIYGSLVKGKEKPNDLDVMVIFLEGNLRERLDIIQEIKSKISKKINDIKIDIKQMLLKEIFNPEFFASAGIFLEGFSIFRDKQFSKTLGFTSFALFTYSLNGLSHTEKVKFNYILAGRNSEGILTELKAKRLVNGAVKVPLENSEVFENILKRNNITYRKRNILEEI